MGIKGERLVEMYEEAKQVAPYGHLAWMAVCNDFKTVDNILDQCAIPLIIVKTVATMFCEDPPHPLADKKYEEVKLRLFYELLIREQEAQELFLFMEMQLSDTTVVMTESDRDLTKGLVFEYHLILEYMSYIKDTVEESKQEQKKDGGV